MITLNKLAQQHHNENTRKVLKEILNQLPLHHIRLLDRILYEVESGNLDLSARSNKKYDNYIQNCINIIVKKIKSNELDIPVFPITAKKIIQMLEDDKLTIKKIADAMKYDPAVATRIINVSNSAIYTSYSKVNNVETALIKIGLDEAKKQLQSIAIKEVFNIKIESFKRLIYDISLHSSLVAHAAFLIASIKKVQNSNQYILLALLHDVGKLWIIKIIAEMMQDGSVVSFQEKDMHRFFKVLHTKLGYTILKKWKLSDEHCKIALKHHDSYNANDQKLLIVQAANVVVSALGFSEKTENITEEEFFIYDILDLDDNHIDDIKKQLLQFKKLFELI